MNKLHMFSSVTMALALSLSTGCAADDSESSTSEAATSDTGTAGDGQDDGNTSAGPGGDGTAGDADAGMTDDDDDGTDTTPGTDVDDGTDPLPDGSTCTEDADCESTHCFVAGALGGICGECTSDADCDGGGCSLPNPLTSAPSTCNMGEVGGGCESDEICEEGLVCAEILNVPGILEAATCSVCDSDKLCAKGETCQPEYDVANISGQKVCAPDGSLEDGVGCDLETGAAACASGFCQPADIMGLLTLGVCSGCGSDDDCGGAACNPPEIDLAKGLVAGGCAE